MKNIPIILLALAFITLVWQRIDRIRQHDIAKSYKDSTAYWHGRYDTLSKADLEVIGEVKNIDINMWADKDSVYALIATPSFGHIPLYKMQTLSLDGIYRWRSLAYPVRHARHRKDKPYKYPHDEEINLIDFPDYIGSIDSLTARVIRNQDSNKNIIIKDINKFCDSVSKPIHH